MIKSMVKECFHGPQEIPTRVDILRMKEMATEKCVGQTVVTTWVNGSEASSMDSVKLYSQMVPSKKDTLKTIFT